jgi:outer membrane receptor protein involved in Fe transport
MTIATLRFAAPGSFGFAAALTATTCSLLGQTASENRADSELTRLSPFVVTTSGDIGYLAQNSVAGSRLNTKLSELAAPTTAFTQEFLEDVAATSVDDLYVYMANTQVTYYEDASASVAGDRKSATIRGLPGGRNSINFFPSDLKMDSFNTERIDFSRGANSILFGMGSPGGIVNVSTRRARFNDVFGSVTLQAVRGTASVRRSITISRYSRIGCRCAWTPCATSGRRGARTNGTIRIESTSRCAGRLGRKPRSTSTASTES